MTLKRVYACTFCGLPLVPTCQHARNRKLSDPV